MTPQQEKKTAYHPSPPSQTVATKTEDNTEDEWIMWQICRYWRLRGEVSPLCDNRDLYQKLKGISDNRGVDFGLAVWITYAESHIWINFNPHYCDVSNNRAGKKREKYDDGSNSVRFHQQDNYIPWCRVYNFESVDEFWQSHVNSLWYGYVSKWCDTPECISKRRVQWDGKTSPSRNRRVRLFMK